MDAQTIREDVEHGCQLLQSAPWQHMVIVCQDIKTVIAVEGDLFFSLESVDVRRRHSYAIWPCLSTAGCLIQTS